MNAIILKLRTDELVMGIPAKETDKGIDLKDVLSLRYEYNSSGYPILFFSKYSLFTLSFDVFFAAQDIMHVFRDPIKSFVEYYQQNVEKLKQVSRDDIPLTKENVFDEEDEEFDMENFLFGDTKTLN